MKILIVEDDTLLLQGLILAAQTILRGVSTGGGYTSFASNGPGSTATLAASCRGRNSPGCLH